jgi:methionyl-tRNA formyltransferase
VRIFLFGLYGLGARALERLLEVGVEVAGIATKPGVDPGLMPFLQIAGRRAIPAFAPASPGEPAFVEAVTGLRPDLIAIAGYHQRVPREILRIPRLGVVNAHLSLLPAYRGPTPWKWAIVRGEERTGVSVHRVTPRFDQGELLLQRPTPIGDEETGGALFERLSKAGADALAETVLKLPSGEVTGLPQDESQASYFSAPTDGDARIRWDASAPRIRNLVRGLNPRPGAWTVAGEARLRILRASVVEDNSPARPGTLLEGPPGSLWIASGSGLLEVLEWSCEGEGTCLEAGVVLGDSTGGRGGLRSG